MLYLTYPAWLKPEVISGLPLRWYGIMYLLAFFTTWYLFRYQVKKAKAPISDDDISSYFFWAILGLLVGSRLVSTLLYDTSGFYWRQPWLIFWPFRNGKFIGLSGMSYHGGLIGAVVSCIAYTTIKKYKTLEWGDWLVAGIPLGYTFGRLGNFINGELWGRVTTRPWGMIFPDAPLLPLSNSQVAEAAEKIGLDTVGKEFINLPRHPSQLYEAFLEGILQWFFLWFIIKRIKEKKGKFHGFVLIWFLIGYAVMRILVEYYREPDIEHTHSFFGKDEKIVTYFFNGFQFYTTGQLLSFLMIIGAVLFYVFFTKWSKKQKIQKEELPTHKKRDWRKMRKKVK